MSLRATTSQTVGPFFEIGFRWLHCESLAGDSVSGARITLQGRIFDGDGAPVPDAVLEIWQANAQGKYDHPADEQNKLLEPGFKGFARVPVNSKGIFRFATIKPGLVPGPEGRDQAPHLLISIFLRGVLRRLVTRIYFPDEPRNATDFILNLVPAERRSTLIARKKGGESAETAAGADHAMLEWNVVLQGPEETVFFDLGL